MKGGVGIDSEGHYITISGASSKGEARRLVDTIPYFSLLLSVETRRQGYYEPNCLPDYLDNLSKVNVHVQVLPILERRERIHKA